MGRGKAKAAKAKALAALAKAKVSDLTVFFASEESQAGCANTALVTLGPFGRERR